MKRLVIASTLLVLLLAGSLVHAQFLAGLTGSISVQLEQARALAESGRVEEALVRTRAARQCWQDHSCYLYVTARHEDADQIRLELESAVHLLEQENTPEYARLSTELMVRLELLAAAEGPSPANIL